MIKDVLQDIGGIGAYGVISICLLFAVFVGSVVWAATRKKSELDAASHLPLDGGETGGDSSQSRNP